MKCSPPIEKLKEDKANYARSFYTQYCNTDSIHRKASGGTLPE